MGGGCVCGVTVACAIIKIVQSLVPIRPPVKSHRIISERVVFYSNEIRETTCQDLTKRFDFNEKGLDWSYSCGSLAKR